MLSQVVFQSFNSSIQTLICSPCIRLVQSFKSYNSSIQTLRGVFTSYFFPFSFQSYNCSIQTRALSGNAGIIFVFQSYNCSIQTEISAAQFCPVPFFQSYSYLWKFVLMRSLLKSTDSILREPT